MNGPRVSVALTGRVARKGKRCGSVAWKGKRCVEGKALRGRESVAWKGKRCAALRCPGEAGPSHFVRLAPYATTPPAPVSRTHHRRHIICPTWPVLRAGMSWTWPTRTCEVSSVIGACCGVEASSLGRAWATCSSARLETNPKHDRTMRACYTTIMAA